jgi:hypothetical protein
MIVPSSQEKTVVTVVEIESSSQARRFTFPVLVRLPLRTITKHDWLGRATSRLPTCQYVRPEIKNRTSLIFEAENTSIPSNLSDPSNDHVLLSFF